MPYEIELRLPALTSCLHVVTACVGRLCRTTVGTEDQAFQQAVHAACEHAIQRSVSHDDDARLELCFYVDENELLVELIDHGRPDAPSTLLVEGNGADEVRYERVEDGNRITLRRRGKHTS